MNRLRIKIFAAILGALLVSSANALTLKDTPIQRQFAQNISNNFETKSIARAFDGDQEFKKSDSPKRENKKSLVKAGLYSALLPGLGEFYVGHKSKARVFFAVEAATWVSFFSFHIYGNLKENDYIDFAAVHANANLEGKSHDFKDWVGFYEDIDQFNSLGRVQDPERAYLEDTPENHWRWESVSAQETYRHLKNRSREAHRRRDFMVGLAVVSRIVSIIDSVRDAKRSQRELSSSDFSLAGGLNYRLEIDPFDINQPVSLALYKRF